MEKSIFYYEISKYLKKNFKSNKPLNILEIGCGSKIYKKIAHSHNYDGLDLPDSIWINPNDRPEIEKKLSEFNPIKKYDLIYSVAAIYLLDENDLKNLIKIISDLKSRNGKIIIFDYKINTIKKIGSKQNNYQEILTEKFKDNFKLINTEWCSNNFIKKFIKEKIKINKSHIIEINFNI